MDFDETAADEQTPEVHLFFTKELQLALKSQPLEFYNYYKDIENGDEMFDCRLELLTDTFGPDIPYIIMTYLNAIYSILNTTFMFDIFYNADAGGKNAFGGKKVANCTCSIYFNRNNEIAQEIRKKVK